MDRYHPTGPRAFTDSFPSSVSMFTRQEYPQLTIYPSALFELSPVSGDVMVYMLGNNRTPRLSIQCRAALETVSSVSMPEIT